MRTSPVILLAAALLASACDSKPAPSKSDEKAPAAAQAPTAEAKTPAPAPAPVGDSADSTPAAAPAPAWFDAEKVPGATLTKQMASQGAVGEGGQATAMILELEAGVTPQQCVEQATALIAAEVGEVPEATEAGGRLTIQGKAEGYTYTVVCGDANGKPTMYLAYNA